MLKYVPWAAVVIGFCVLTLTVWAMEKEMHRGAPLSGVESIKSIPTIDLKQWCMERNYDWGAKYVLECLRIATATTACAQKESAR